MKKARTRVVVYDESDPLRRKQTSTEITTDWLISELTKRKPDCKKCAWPTCDLCLGCFWKDFGGKDIFREETKK